MSRKTNIQERREYIHTCTHPSIKQPQEHTWPRPTKPDGAPDNTVNASWSLLSRTRAGSQERSRPSRVPETSPAHPTLRRLPEPGPPCRRRRATDGRPGLARRKDPRADTPHRPSPSNRHLASLPCAPEIQIEKIGGYEAGGDGARDRR